jgi:hypothetical protein
MAAITANSSQPDGTSFLVAWEQINDDNEGAAVQIPPVYARKTIQAGGTFNGGAYASRFSTILRKASGWHLEGCFRLSPALRLADLSASWVQY